ncbi:hypothetical protein F4821DRAFT_138681 [Hypoxylon rubiginosum]|uniref:Uncharacterized protein n=1 Tax=Hypoxylon rubiginosum TaxID=110542 RepID=A0ACC0DIJ0_9PEZI|nr:hypothetical protein F4821DRAFT_138681 [Hypoxylon rubiginosum]
MSPNVFSMFPYSAMPHDHDPCRDHPGYDQWYAESESSEPLSDGMSQLLRRELENIFYESAARHRRDDCDEVEIRQRWYRDPDNYGMMPTLNHLQIDEAYFTSIRHYSELEYYLNKTTAMYIDVPGKLDCYSDVNMGRYIYRQWYRMHGGRPSLQRHHYFTNATWIRENGPHTISEIIKFHRSLCDSVSARLDDPVGFGNYRNFKNPEDSEDSEDSGDLELRSSGDRPTPSYSAKSWRSHGFTLGHLYRAMFIVVDDQVARDIVRGARLGREAGWERNISQYTVLLVKTGDDTHLSSPICFNPLVESGMTLAVNRADVGGNVEGEDVVRVKLDVAMKFILDLVHREEEAIPCVRQAAELLREEHDNECQRWVERVLEHAMEVGIDNNGFTWQCIRRAQARLNGEAFDVEQINPIFEALTYWW